MAFRLVGHLILFGVSKSAVLISPLLAATILTKGDYGLLEWALSFSMMSAVFVSLGAGGVIAFEIVRKERSCLINTALFYSALLTFILGCITVLLTPFDSLRAVISVGFTGIYIGQFALASYMKSKGMGAYASVVDSFIYIQILLLVLYGAYVDEPGLQFLTILPVSIILLSILLFRIAGSGFSIFSSGFILFAKKGAPIMLSGFAAIGYINLPRLLIGVVGSMEDVGNLALYFRWAALALVVYQFMLVMNFRKIYRLGYVELDKYISYITLAVLIAGAIIVAVMPVVRNFVYFNQLQFPEMSLPVQSLMVCIVTVWTLSTSLEGLFYREHLTKFQVASVLLGGSSFLGLVFIIRNIAAIEIVLTFCIAWFLSYLIITFSQIYFLRNNLSASEKRGFGRSLFLVVIILFLEMILLFKIS